VTPITVHQTSGPTFVGVISFASLEAHLRKTQKIAPSEIGRQIRRPCDPGATAVVADTGYGVTHEPIQRVSMMFAYVVNEGRLFALKPSDWSMLLGGVALCGLLTLFF